MNICSVLTSSNLTRLEQELETSVKQLEEADRNHEGDGESDSEEEDGEGGKENDRVDAGGERQASSAASEDDSSDINQLVIFHCFF